MHIDLEIELMNLSLFFAIPTNTIWFDFLLL